MCVDWWCRWQTQCGPPIHDCHSCMCKHTYMCRTSVSSHLSCMHTDPESKIIEKKTSESALSYKKKWPRSRSPGDRMGCRTTLRCDTMKNIVKTIFCPWRCKKEPDEEQNWEEKRERKRKKKEERKGSAKWGKKVKRERNSKHERREKWKKSSLSGFGNSDSWGPFVLITAEQRFCRY